jgi:hypothetical protein
VRQARQQPSTPLKRMFLGDDEIRGICEAYVANSLASDAHCGSTG